MTITNETVHAGRCLCGKVTFTAIGIPIIVAHCHCKDCQRLSGAGHSTGAMFPTERFKLNGECSQYELTSENGNTVTRVFCPGCGSPIHGQNSGMEGHVTISLGLFDDSSEFVPEVTVFNRNRKPWDIMDESIMAFDAQPGWKPNPD